MIKLYNADKYYNKNKPNEIHVINNIDLELPDSGMVAIFGRSGCGKTTLLNAIGGLDSIDSGVITVLGKDIVRQDTDYIRNKYIGYIFQNYNLSRGQTVYENVANALRLCGLEDEEEIRKRVSLALSNVGMEKFFKRMPDALSGGQQQRVAIARAIVKNPAVILADEPTGNLDEANTIMVMDLLKALSKEHLVLLVTHESKLVDYYCDRVIEIVDGSIASERENSGADGYNKRDQNKIYLGELEKKSFELPGAVLEVYGDLSREIKLSVISQNGRLYLRSDTPELRFIDESSEIKVVEGVFEEKKPVGHQTRLDMSALTPIEGKKYGKLFGFRQSLKESFHNNFAEKQKKRNKFLRAMMFVFASVLVLATSAFAVFLRDLQDLNKTRDPDAIYVSLDDADDAGAISSKLGQSGIEGLKLTSYNEIFDRFDSQSQFIFTTDRFMTASGLSIQALGRLCPVSEIPEGATAEAGTLRLENPGEMIITSSVADDMIKNAGTSYIDEYSDLIGLVSSDSYGGIIGYTNYAYYGGRNSSSGYRIVGVIRSDVNRMYVSDCEAALPVINRYYNSVVPASLYDLGKREAPARGEVYLFYREDISSGKNVKIAGKSYTVAYSVSNSSFYDYASFVKSELGLALQNANEYIEQNSGQGQNEFQLRFKWYFEYYLEHFQEYLAAKVQARSIEEIEWAAYKSKDIIPVILTSASYANGMSEYELYCAYLYNIENGEYPEDDETLSSYLREVDESLNEYGGASEFMYVMSKEIFLQYEQEYYDVLYSGGYFSAIVMNDQDFVSLAYSTASSDDNISYFDDFFSKDDAYNRYRPQLYMRVRSSDIAATESALRSVLPNSELITPDDFYDKLIADSIDEIISEAISLVVVLALMSLCIFFIMRSAFMSRVREIGIYRAIGVSKKNLIFRYLVETLLITTLTVFIGYLISSLIMAYLSTTVIISKLFYYPLWIALVLLAVIYGVCTLFGTLPIMLMMRKTPSQILAKYDI